MLDKKIMRGQLPTVVRPGRVRQLPRQLVMCAMLIVVSAVFTAAQTGAKPTEDLPSGSMQAKAIASCQECHEARIILQQRLNKAAWTKEVDKMIKWGAVVDANDHDALIDYLSTNFNPDQPAYEPPRTVAEKSSSKNSETKKSK